MEDKGLESERSIETERIQESLKDFINNVTKRLKQ